MKVKESAEIRWAIENIKTGTQSVFGPLRATSEGLWQDNRFVLPWNEISSITAGPIMSRLHFVSRQRKISVFVGNKYADVRPLLLFALSRCPEAELNRQVMAYIPSQRAKSLKLDGPAAALAILSLVIGIAVFIALSIYTMLPEPLDAIACTIPIIMSLLTIGVMIVISLMYPTGALINRLATGIGLVLTSMSVLLLFLTSASIAYVNGDISRYRGNPEEAEQYYLSAIEQGNGARTVIDVQSILIRMYIDSERYADAEDMLVENYEKDSMVWHEVVADELPAVLRNQGKDDEAEKWCERLKKEYPRYEFSCR